MTKKFNAIEARNFIMQYQFNTKQFSVLLLSLVCFLFSCSSATDAGSETDSLSGQQYIFTAVGYAPIAAQKGATLDLQVINAIKVSKLEAYKELAEQIHGVLITSTNTVSASSLQNEQIKSRVKGLVRGAKVLKSYHEADMYITELELNLKNMNLLEEAGYNKSHIQVINTEQQVYY